MNESGQQSLEDGKKTGYRRDTLEKLQVHNPQLKMGMPRETENRGINENFINMKMSL